MIPTEFWLRLMSVRALSLSKLSRFCEDVKLCTGTVDDYLSAIQLTRLQETQFWSLEQESLNQTLAWLENDGCHLISYASSDYPELLRHIKHAPVMLFVKGDVSNLNRPQLAMVGSRSFSQYGQSWGSYFSLELAAAGLVITSGLAIGIDSICHRGALMAGGRTIAVLGSGLGDVSPRCNRRLADEIVEKNGSLVSEFLPHTPPNPAYFPQRNRIISGLSQGVFVLEADLKSGSLITARYAIEQGREVFALPGSIDGDGCSGTHWLIQQGAYLVSQPSDILETLNSSLEWLVLDEAQCNNSVDPESNHILQSLSFEATPIDLIAHKVSLPVTDVMVKLIELELNGLVMAVSGGYIKNRSTRIV